MISETLKGTMWAHLNSVTKLPNEKKYNSYSKVSSDYGETWSNLRVICSPDQPKDLFPGDVDDMENYSLKPFSFVGVESSPTAGISITVGQVGKDGFWSDKAMTFISRDGGRSWEVAFEYPCRWAFGDGGNIIVAIPTDALGDNVPKGEFYYSLDQGKTWRKYQLEVPMYLSQITSTTSDGSGLNFIIGGGLRNECLSVLHVDFTDAFNGQGCGSKDLER